MSDPIPCAKDSINYQLSGNKGKLVNHGLSVSVSSSRKKRRSIPKLKKYRGFIPSAQRLAECSILGQ
jgi:hypothetical protein